MYLVNKILTKTSRLNYLQFALYHRAAMNIDHDMRIEKIKRMDLPQRFFCYGTLRDDDDSGALWTAKWTKDVSYACNAKVYGFKMYKERKLKHPFALRTHNNNDYMIGRLLQWNDKQIFYEKVLEADDIEDYDDTHPYDEENEYVRDIVDVHLMDSNNKVLQAILYYQQVGVTPLNNCDEMPNGDWMDRHLLNTFRKISKRIKSLL
eukprot:UN07926